MTGTLCDTCLRRPPPGKMCTRCSYMGTRSPSYRSYLKRMKRRGLRPKPVQSSLLIFQTSDR